MSLTIPPRRTPGTFLGATPVTTLDDLAADIAFLGVPYGYAYSYEDITNDQSNAPTALREASSRIVRSLERYDFDLGGPLYDNRPIRTVDCGDIRSEPGDVAGHSRRTEAAVRAILAAGALPIVLGGDHSIPIPVLRAFDAHGPITLVQIDQHIDWRDEVNGVREGLSSRSGERRRWPMSARSSRSACAPRAARGRRRWMRRWPMAHT
ncbi:MAG: arginase family protein [Acetobacteraceae bacterium]